MRDSGSRKRRRSGARDRGPVPTTRTGDAGETGLLGGARVSKTDPRMAACGDLDELGGWLGAVRAFTRTAPHAAILHAVQTDLIRLGSRLADPRPAAPPFRVDARIRSFERTIERLHARLPALRTFVIPGGTAPSAFLHVARAVCRRAERSVVALAREVRPEPEGLVYLNRLSDLLFLLARAEAAADARQDRSRRRAPGRRRRDMNRRRASRLEA